ncbi:MAG TPA: MATE family efflux transporter [Candidatus Brocadiia bacterium]|nr:MATE family efflux transporter [Candidatus Brocadiia bacterium]
MPALTQGSVPRALFTMAFPMLAGTFAMVAYHFTDTWFVSRLGTLPLAAMGFTFPVVMLVTCVARGIGAGVTALASHALGRRDHDQAAAFVTHGLLLTVAVTILMSIAGYFAIAPGFRLLGATSQTLPLIHDYMSVWYFGAITMSLPMLGNGILISAGDSKTASLFMIAGTAANVILDPIMIFGWLGCPALGMSGAALATVISQAISTAWLISLLVKKHRLLAFHGWDMDSFLASARRITSFAVPSIISMILMPAAAAVITKILSGYGQEAVAASGAGGRIEMFAFVIPMALGISLTPFISQNFGAQRLDRVREAHKVSNTFAILYGAFIAAAFFLCAPWLAAAFSDDPKVTRVLIASIRITAFGFGMMEVHRYCGFFLTGLHKPAAAMYLNATRIVALLIPLSWLGGRLGGVNGVFFGRLAADLAAGVIGLIWAHRAIAAATPRASLAPSAARVLAVPLTTGTCSGSPPRTEPPRIPGIEPSTDA